MQHNSQTNYRFRYRWNSYTENNEQSLRGQEPTQTDFFAHFQRASQTGYINDMKTKISRQMLLKVIIHKILVTLTIPLVDHVTDVFTSTHFFVRELIIHMLYLSLQIYL